MKLLITGVSHRTAPVELRERIVDLARDVVVERVHALRSVDAHQAHTLVRFDQQMFGHGPSRRGNARRSP